jgi:putative transposase
VTVAVRERRAVFGDVRLATAAVAVLRQQAELRAAPVYGYCVMPDHVHLVVGPSPTCDIIAFVAQYKSLVQRTAWQLGITGTFWQVSFWDRFLRAEEQVERVVEYVLNNPVRKGLVARWEEYPFSGSLVLDHGRPVAGDKPPRYSRSTAAVK